MVSTVRERRLRADYNKVREVVAAGGGSIELTSAKGDPPREYLLTYYCRGIEKLERGKPVIREVHLVMITLPPDYPGEKPTAKMLTPMFHPHVFQNNTICIGKWIINESLDNLVLRIGAIIQCDPSYFDFRSPANPEAKAWAERNMHLFPVGTTTFRRSENRHGGIQWMSLQ